MTPKITLITPPDIYENRNPSILLIDVPEHEQDQISQGLSHLTNVKSINIYFYQGEPNVSWLLYALAVADFTYFNVDERSPISEILAGFVLSKSTVFYSTKDKHLVSIYNHINNNCVDNIQEFVNKIFSMKKDISDK